MWDKAGLVSAVQRVGVTPASPRWVRAGGCRAAPIPEDVCDTLRNHPGKGQERDTQGLQHQGADKSMNKHGGNRDMHQRTGRTAFPAAHVGWDGPGDIVTRSSINPTRLCLHNRECFSCFMEVDRNNTGTNEARARLNNACPAPALPSQPIKTFYFKRNTDFTAQFGSSTFHPGTNSEGKAAPPERLPACH